MGSLSKFLVCSGVFLSFLSTVLAQETGSYPIKVDVPVEGAGTFTVSFDLLRGGGINNAARTLCIEQKDAIGVTSNEVLESVCIPKIEEYITAVLLTNKIVERKEPNIVTITIPIKDGEEYSISFDPAKSNAVQTATAFCEQKQKELKITTQEMMDEQCIPKVAEFITSRIQPAPKTTQTLSAVPAPAVETQTVSKSFRDIEIPIENVGKLPLRLNIDSVTPNQAADFFCHHYANDLSLKSENDVQVCVPQISDYIQKLFQISTPPNVQKFTMNVDNTGDLDFSFDVTKVSPDAVANELCVSKGASFGLTTLEEAQKMCVPVVSEFIIKTLKQRNLV